MEENEAAQEAQLEADATKAARNPMTIEITKMDGPEDACRVHGTSTWSFKDGSYSGQDPTVGIIHQPKHSKHPGGMVRAV